MRAVLAYTGRYMAGTPKHTQNCQRLDRGSLGKPELLDNGWMRCDGYVARSGILEYTRADGTAWREYRPDSENAKMMSTFLTLPVTLEHPKTGLLNSTNTREHQVGTVMNLRVDGPRVAATLLLTDQVAITEAQNGKSELSCGYLCDLELTSGEFEGQRYDAIQTNIRGNHVALVSNARAGHEYRLRLDNASLELIELPSGSIEQVKERLVKININKVDYEIPDAAAQALEAERASKKSDTERAQARVDTLEVENSKLRAEMAALPTKLAGEFKARAELEAQAREILPSVKFDGLTDLDIRRQCTEKLTGLALADKSAAYIEVAYDMARAGRASPGPMARGAISVPAEHVDASDSGDALTKAEAKLIEFTRNAYKRG